MVIELTAQIATPFIVTNPSEFTGESGRETNTTEYSGIVFVICYLGIVSPSLRGPVAEPDKQPNIWRHFHFANITRNKFRRKINYL